MASLSDHGAPATVSRPTPTTRAPWLMLADAGMGLDLAERADVIVTARPGEFLARLVASRPRLVVCAEPPADHAVAAAVLRERRRRPGMRVIHLSPPDAIGRRLEALGEGFDDALSTATPPAELLGRLTWLDARSRNASAGESLLPITETLVLDLVAHALWRDGQQVHLRPKEYALLRLLATNPGRAMSRPDLLRHIWGPERGADSRTLDVHVRWLRAKIEPDPAHAAHLVTVRGVGYRFDPPR